MNQEELPSARRPLKVRNLSIMTRIATSLANKGVHPNHISLFSIFFAFIAMISLMILSQQGLSNWAMLCLALFSALAIQGRLLCNLFDGMVAVEGGKSTASGELFNDIPDRIADPMIIIGLGFAANQFQINIGLGCMAALLAVFTAYVRTLSASIGAPVDFSGPMAKQHRMAVVTIACVLCAFEIAILESRWSLTVALWVLVIGTLITIARRSHRAYRYLEQNNLES